MRKALLLTVAAALLGFVGTAMAQGPWNFSGTASNQVFVTIPTVLAMHITGTTSGSTTNTDVVLSPSASDIISATSGSTFDTNTGGFTGLVAFTNATNGAKITTSTQDVTNTGDSANVLSFLDVTEAGTTSPQGLSGSAQFSVPRGGQKTILDSTSFSLALDPSIVPSPSGGYKYIITYTMTAN